MESDVLQVQLTEPEWRDLLIRESRGLPDVLQFNIENDQWESMDANLSRFLAQIERVKRILSAKHQVGTT